MRVTWTSKWKPGQSAPKFKSVLHDGSELRSDDLLGKKYILFFYNHDGTETCTKEACNLRDNYTRLKRKGYDVIGVSVDSNKKHQRFIEKYEFQYPLITDEDNTLAKLFDIYGEKKFMGRISDAVHRTTFLVDEKGKFELIIHPVKSSNHTEQILEELKKAKNT
jgi:peroxiredoxin Q/BCP